MKNTNGANIFLAVLFIVALLAGYGAYRATQECGVNAGPSFAMFMSYQSMNMISGEAYLYTCRQLNSSN